jgi:hypothetical protein
MADRPKRHTAPVDYASVKIGTGTPAWMRNEQVRLPRLRGGGAGDLFV